MLLSRNQITTLLGFIRALIGYNRWQVLQSFVLLIFMGISQGVSLLLLIPFLALAGVTETDQSDSGLAARVKTVFEHTGFELSLINVLLAYIFIFSCYALTLYWQSIVNTQLIQGFTRQLRNKLHQAFIEAKWLFITQIRTADVANLLVKETGKTGSSTQLLIRLITQFILALVHIGLALVLSWQLTLMALAGILVLILIQRSIMRAAYESGEGSYLNHKVLFSMISEHLNGLKLVKGYGSEERHHRQYNEITKRVKDHANRFQYSGARSKLVFDIGGVLLISAFFYAALVFWKIPVIELLLIVYIFARLLPRFSTMMTMYNGLLNNMPSFDAIEDMWVRFRENRENISQAVPEPLACKKEILLEGVSFRYEAGQPILTGIDLKIPANQTIALTGPSGSGKTTLSDLIMGLLQPDQGSIKVDGTDISGSAGWRQAIGYVPQDGFLFHDTIRANLLWANPQATTEALWEALENASARSFVEQLKDGIDTVVGDKGVRLSGGERQRIALARALVRKPTLLVLDEATSNLDDQNETHIRKAIRDLHRKMTILLIAHRSTLIDDADQTVVLEQGRVKEIVGSYTL